MLVPALSADNPDGDRCRTALRARRLIAPELIDVEIISALRCHRRAGRLDDRRAGLALTDLRALPMRRVSHRRLVRRCWELRGNLTAYDAAYVALAELLDLPLVTADSRLAASPDLPCRVELLRQ